MLHDKENKLAGRLALSFALLLSSFLLAEANYEALPKSNLVGEKNSLPELVHQALTSKAPLLIVEQPSHNGNNNNNNNHLNLASNDNSINKAVSELFASTKAPVVLEATHNGNASGHLAAAPLDANIKAPSLHLLPVHSDQLSSHAPALHPLPVAEHVGSALSSGAAPLKSPTHTPSSGNVSHTLAALFGASATTKAPLLMPASISLATTAKAALSTAAPATLTGVAASVKPSAATSIASLLAKEETKGEHELKGAPISVTPALNSTATNEPLPKLCDYLKPMCETSALDKISPKQLLKVQSHFKKFVELTKGKLGSCFLDHYNFEPALKPISVAEVHSVCASKNLPANLKGSYKSFKACAVKNWNAAVDIELDKILAARANCTKLHKHNETVLAHDDDDEINLINEVVTKVLGGDKSIMNNSNVRVIDFSGNTVTAAPSIKPAAVVSVAPAHAAGSSRSAALLSTLAPSVAPGSLASLATSTKPTVVGHQALVSSAAPALSAFSLAHSSLAPALSAAHTTLSPELSAIKANVNGMINDPNTVLVFVDDSTSKPGKASGSTHKPALGALSTAKAASVTTSAPKKEAALAQKLINAASSAAPTLGGSTVKPSILLTASTKVPSAASVVAPSAKAPINKQLATIEEVLKRQEKEKAELENKLKLEREKLMKQLQKKQDELDAHYAIKALQAQREHSSDAKLHQLEHQRQMAIDPVGHTIKHQQYELNKQQKLLSKS